MATRVRGVSSIVLLGLVATGGCTQPNNDPIGTTRQAVVNGCLLSTVGAACDPDDDGPLGACDGLCVLQGRDAWCVQTDSVHNEGMPCGQLQSEHVECNTSCRKGVCTTSDADDGTACMPSGSPEHSAVCEGACNAGTCDKLYHPKRCYGADAGPDDGGATSGDGGVSGDGGTSTADGAGGSGGDGGGGGGGDDGGAASGGDSGAASGDDSGSASGGDSGVGSDDDTGSASGDDTGSASGDDTGVGTSSSDDSGAKAGDDGGGPNGAGDAGPAADDGGGVVTADAPAGNDGSCGCRTAGNSSSTAGAFFGLAIVFARLRRRRT